MKLYNIILCLLFLSLNVQAQLVPQAISFQGMAMDASGNLIANTTVDVEVDIISGSASGLVIYSEIHSNLTTTNLGHFTIEIGRGSSNGFFSNINWGSNNYCLLYTSPSPRDS